MAALDRVFSTIAEFTKTMGSLQGDYLQIVRQDIDRFLSKTNDLSSQMNWQAWSVVALCSVSASLAVAGSLIPKGADLTSTPLNNPRAGANGSLSDAASDALKAIGTKLGDNEFLRSTSKTGAKFFNGLSSPADTWCRSKTTKTEAERELLRLAFQEGQQEKSLFGNEARRAQESALAILQSKAKGG